MPKEGLSGGNFGNSNSQHAFRPRYLADSAALPAIGFGSVIALFPAPAPGPTPPWAIWPNLHGEPRRIRSGHRLV